MTSKRKAELQRKLSMTSVPKPPAGLSERLKADIPENVMSVERDRERFRRSATRSMGVAASILLLITSVYLALHFVARSSEEVKIASTPPSMITRKPVPTATQAEVTITLAEQDKDMNSGRAAEVTPVMQREEQSANVVHRDRRQEKAGKKTTLVAESKNEPARETRQLDKVATVAEMPAASAPGNAPATLPAPAPPPPPPAMADANVAAAAAKAEAITITAAAPSIISTAQAASLSYTPPRAVFGLSIDPAVFQRVKEEIDKGERPVTQTSDLSAIINYFAGPAKSARHDINLDVEASRAPLTNDNSALLRFTVDTARETVAAGALVAPVAIDANLEIHLNSNVVLSHRLIGADELKAQSTLLKNVSVTGLMDLKLKPAIAPGTTIATLRLRYRSITDGKEKTIVKQLRAHDVQRTWASASWRHRLPTLGAAWSESLVAPASACDVSRAADRLATEAPGDARAKELAALASASCRLQSSAPTGSAR